MYNYLGSITRVPSENGRIVPPSLVQTSDVRHFTQSSFDCRHGFYGRNIFKNKFYSNNFN